MILFPNCKPVHSRVRTSKNKYRVLLSAQLHSRRRFFYYLDCTLRMQICFVPSKQENNSSRNPLKAFSFTSFCCMEEWTCHLLRYKRLCWDNINQFLQREFGGSSRAAAQKVVRNRHRSTLTLHFIFVCLQPLLGSSVLCLPEWMYALKHLFFISTVRERSNFGHPYILCWCSSRFLTQESSRILCAIFNRKFTGIFM